MPTGLAPGGGRLVGEDVHHGRSVSGRRSLNAIWVGAVIYLVPLARVMGPPCCQESGTTWVCDHSSGTLERGRARRRVAMPGRPDLS